MAEVMEGVKHEVPSKGKVNGALDPEKPSLLSFISIKRLQKRNRNSVLPTCPFFKDFLQKDRLIFVFIDQIVFKLHPVVFFRYTFSKIVEGQPP